MTTPNHAGVHLDAEQIVILADASKPWREYAEIKIGQAERGYFVAVGVGHANGGTYSPCCDYPPHFETRDDALRQGLRDVERKISQRESRGNGEAATMRSAQRLRRAIAGFVVREFQADLFEADLFEGVPA